ncbi:hypothetical protein A9D14_14205 [Croceicoccus marinus]|uniref:Uncharacterized protein n=2 Tax=Croceicoccus marinus TaxID=450378 RepID=A0A1Z1FED2_9SPHN|nr:hypothetical protein A9D14_14205 [Croceicoccus marinus]
MPFYRVMIHGSNFSASRACDGERHGFYTTRFVQALNPTRAEFKAVDWVRKKYVRNFGAPGRDPMPIMRRESVQKVRAMPPMIRRGAGFTLYRSEEDGDQI